MVTEFEKYYDQSRRRDILAVVTAMDFANRFNNTFTGLVLLDPEARLEEQNQ